MRCLCKKQLQLLIKINWSIRLIATDRQIIYSFLLHLPCLSVKLSRLFTHNYRPQRSWGKVIFSQVSVILSTGGGGRGMWHPSMPCSRGVSDPGGVAWSGGSAPGGYLVETPRTATAAGGTHPTGMYSCLQIDLWSSILEVKDFRMGKFTIFSLVQKKYLFYLTEWQILCT